MSQDAPTLPDTARCTQCGYRLRDLPSNRCPECGRMFDPHDPWSYAIPGRHQPGRPDHAGRALVLSCVVAVMLFCCKSSRVSGMQWIASLIFIAAAALKILQVQRAGCRDSVSLAKARIAVAVLVLSPAVLLPPYAGGCPCGHATVVAGVGPVGLAWSNSHGPCHNAPFDNGQHIHLWGRWWIAWLDHDYH